MNAPPFPTNPTFGQFFGNWVWSGSRWVCTNTNGVRLVVQVFRASAPYMPSPGLISAVVEAYGGGGGSGGVVSPGPEWVIGAGGAGSGGYSRIALASGLVLGGVNVIIGAGGAGSGALANTGGGDGGATSFGAFCVANGGLGGSDNNGTTGFGQGGGEAAPGVGDVAFPGAAGFCGQTLTFAATTSTTGQGGMGGTLLGGTRALNVGIGEILAGLPAYPNTGAGASGACANQYPTPGGATGGGAGGSGICIVTEYCWADAIDDGCGCGPTGQARVAIAGPQGWQGGFDND
jgi:hypothetical protein